MQDRCLESRNQWSHYFPSNSLSTLAGYRLMFDKGQHIHLSMASKKRFESANSYYTGWYFGHVKTGGFHSNFLTLHLLLSIFSNDPRAKGILEAPWVPFYQERTILRLLLVYNYWNISSNILPFINILKFYLWQIVKNYFYFSKTNLIWIIKKNQWGVFPLFFCYLIII